MVFYRLRGHDIGNNPFVYSVPGYDDLTFLPPSFNFHLLEEEIIFIAPNQISTVNAAVQYEQSPGKSIGVILEGVTSSSLITVNFIQSSQVLSGGIIVPVQFEVIASGMLLPGTPSLILNISMTDDCKFHTQDVTIPLFVCNPINVNVTNISSLSSSTKSLQISWNKPVIVAGTLQTYKLSINFENETKISYEFSNSSLSYNLHYISPYQLVYLSITAFDQFNTSIGCSSKQQFRTEESGN